MSARVRDRRVSELLVVVKAKEMAIYTIRVTNNEKNFPKRYRFSVTNKIQDKAMEIVENLIEANEFYPKSETEYNYRRLKQQKAMACCRSLLTMLDMSKELFAINSKKTEYWTRQIFDVRNLTAAWLKKDKQRFNF